LAARDRNGGLEQCQLYDDDVAEMNGMSAAGHRFRQVRIFADAYGLPVKDGHRLGDRIIAFAA
jgi:hypothetical protein